LSRDVLTAQVPLLVGVGVLAGIVSTVASVASIVSYPALLAIGLPPLSANVTNTVALAFTGVGATVGSRPELAGQSRLVWRLALLTACGGATGAAVLLLTPARTFEAVAPFFIAFASVVILFQPKASGMPAAGGHTRDRLLSVGVFAVSIYTGYFGAAGGILMLAVLTAKLSQTLVRVNAVKNVVSGVANAVAAVAFAFFGPVRWTAAVPLAVGFLVGGWAGPWLVRRIPAAALRVIVSVLGLLVAAKLAVSAYA
jgi:uncharacterized membrane protein YfcA